MRTCTKCKKTLPLSEFYEHTQTPDGIDRWCKGCKKQSNYRYRKEHLAEYRERDHRYWVERSPERDARLRAHKQRHLNGVRKAVIAHYGGACACCGETFPEFLTIDHINGGGTAERRRLKRTGVHFWHWLMKQGFPEGYRLLCFNCNSARGAYGYCPHDRVNALSLVGACNGAA